MHEGISNPKIRDFPGHIDTLFDSYDYVGDCCGTYTDPRRPTPRRCAWIERNEEDCLISSEIAIERQMDPKRWRFFLELKREWIAKHQPFIINFDQLFTMGGAFALWMEMVDVEFPAKKVEVLLEQNIQRNVLSYDMQLVTERIINHQ